MPPGILYVTMQPKPSLPAAQFHDWYNNEHGPGRLRFPKIFENGFRYRATDLNLDSSLPEWMAVYDVIDMDEMLKEPYISLRKAPIQSQRERDTMAQITVDRKFYDLELDRHSEKFTRLEQVSAEGQGNALVVVYIKPHPGKKEEVDKWYTEEHITMLSKVPGWLRTRRFVTASVEDKKPDGEPWLVALHEYAPINGLGGPEFKAATSTPWAVDIRTSIAEFVRRTYELVYTFGPAPRDIGTLTAPFTSYDGQTREFPDAGAIESYVTTPDGVALPYRLEGSADPSAPLIVLSSSILVDWGIWDGFVAAFKDIKEYRILRYLTRGRSAECGSQAITIDVLAADIIALLDALRVKTAACVIGVSMGGATALNVGLKYPTRVASFIACDTSSSSLAGNSKAWGERIAISESEGASTAGLPVVGSKLAEATTRRWFDKASYDGGKMEAEIERVKTMVANNSLAGFKKSVEALFEYDVKGEMGAYAGKGLFVVGGSDGVLPGSMKEMAKTLGKDGVECEVIDGAGHLPMVEKPVEFAEIVSSFLKA